MEVVSICSVIKDLRVIQGFSVPSFEWFSGWKTHSITTGGEILFCFHMALPSWNHIRILLWLVQPRVRGKLLFECLPSTDRVSDWKQPSKAVQWKKNWLRTRITWRRNDSLKCLNRSYSTAHRCIEWTRIGIGKPPGQFTHIEVIMSRPRSSLI